MEDRTVLIAQNAGAISQGRRRIKLKILLFSSRILKTRVNYLILQIIFSTSDLYYFNLPILCSSMCKTKIIICSHFHIHADKLSNH